MPLGWFRVAIALFCITKLLVVRRSLLDIYGQYGFVQWVITRANLYVGLPHLGNVIGCLRSLGLALDQAVVVMLYLHCLVLCGLLIGFCTRWVALLTWFMNFLWMHAGGGLMYGMDIFTHIALFYCVIMPVSAYLSVDACLNGHHDQSSVAAGVTRRMLQLHMCIIYLSSGIEKAAGSEWRNGEAIWRALMLPVFRQFDMTWLAHVPWLAMLITWLVLAIEIGYAFLIWWRKTRWIWLGLAVGMHLAIGLFLGMWLFALIMVILNLAAFGYDVFPHYNQLVKQITSSSLLKPGRLLRPRFIG